MVNFWCNQIIDPKTNEYVTVLQIVGKIQELSFINRKTFVLLKSYYKSMASLIWEVHKLSQT